MIDASNEFKEKLKKGANLVNYADITLSDGTVLHLTYKDFMIGGCQIEDKTTDGKFGVGFVIGKTLTMRIANHDERFSKHDFYQSTINLYVALQLDDGSIERIRKGIYYTVVPETPGDTIEISAVDGMYRLDKDYAGSRTAYPASLQTILSDACLDCGIPIGFRQFDNMNFMVQEKPEKATYRQIVSYAAQIAGYNARIDNDGYMQLIWYDTALLEQYNYVGGDFRTYLHDTVLNGGNFADYGTETIISGGNFADPVPVHIFRVKSLNVHTDNVMITGVRVTGEEDQFSLYGEEGYLIEVKGNPFVNGKEQAVAAYLGERMVGMAFRPFTAQALNNPLYEPFEVVRVSDRKGNVYVSIINSISYKIGAYTQISCEAEDPARNGSTYSSPAAQAVVEARRNAEKQLTTYDKAVQNMNQLAANAMGYHTTYEDQPDGSRITYLHDRPLLSESRTIYKQTIDGFFISTDGGNSYTAGFDKNGNAVVNILYAIGIVADWIRGGTLSLGGENNINGDMIVYNSSGEVIGRFNKDGLWASNGYFEGTIKSSSAEISGGTINIGVDSATKGIIKLYKLFSVTETSAELSASQLHLRSTVVSTPYETKIKAGHIEVASGDKHSKISSNEITMTGGIYGSFFAGSVVILTEGITSVNGVFSGTLTALNLAVSGVKARNVNTKNYSHRLLYCYEMPKPYFGDIGEATLDNEGVGYIFLDDIFSETVNTNCQYQVFLQKYGPGDVWVEERTVNYFVVRGTAGIRFGWEIKARQLGYEFERMEKFIQTEPEETIDYEMEAQKYIENYYTEVLNYEKSN